MNKKLIVLGALLLTSFATSAAPVLAETGKDTTRFEKLEERVREVEARLAKVEASSHKQMGMMQQHGHDMMNKGMQQGQGITNNGANNAMGQAPQQGMPQGGGMPSGGGMGDM